MQYAYAIVRAGHRRPRCRGVGTPGNAVRLVASGPIAAAVSDVAHELQLDDADAHTHLNVLTELLKRGPVLPLRLGTVADTDADIGHQLLDPMAERSVALLDALEDTVELHVDADDDERGVLTELARSGLVTPGGYDMRDAIAEGERIAATLVQYRIQLVDELLARLAPHAVDNVPRSMISGPEDPLLRWAFLVRRDQLDDFDAAVGQMEQDYPALAFRYVGPLPAAHFVDRVVLPDAAERDADQFAGSGRWGW